MPPIGRVLAPCAELAVIHFAVTRVISGAELYKCIIVFTDSIALAERAVDPSLHSGQAHSLAVCKALNEWLFDDDDQEIKFVEVPSSAKWSVHHSAHLFVRGLPPIGTGSAPQTSLDYLRKKATDACQDVWVTRFQEAKYKGGQFLELNDLKGKPLQPKYTGGGTWLPHIGCTNSLTLRVIRRITNHAPVGEYYCRFHIPESEDCRCGRALETCLHVLFCCPQAVHTGPIRYLGDLVNFLDANPEDPPPSKLEPQRLFFFKYHPLMDCWVTCPFYHYNPVLHKEFYLNELNQADSPSVWDYQHEGSKLDNYFRWDKVAVNNMWE
ncbi:hypothetical protein PQX77_017702 [Marasmius sp. AFHP31]|nr:hypothetical protein PQX77_017702 [Marasmius sp. AFHP31]